MSRDLPQKKPTSSESSAQTLWSQSHNLKAVMNPLRVGILWRPKTSIFPTCQGAHLWRVASARIHRYTSAGGGLQLKTRSVHQPFANRSTWSFPGFVDGRAIKHSKSQKVWLRIQDFFRPTLGVVVEICWWLDCRTRACASECNEAMTGDQPLLVFSSCPTSACPPSKKGRRHKTTQKEDLGTKDLSFYHQPINHNTFQIMHH